MAVGGEKTKILPKVNVSKPPFVPFYAELFMVQEVIILLHIMLSAKRIDSSLLGSCPWTCFEVLVDALRPQTSIDPEN